MKLHWALASPFVRKVMVVAHETGTVGRLQLIETTVSMAEANPVVQRANPLSKIPTLILEDGTSLYDSRAICEYLDSLHDGPKLFPPAPLRWDALRRHCLGDGLMDALILWRQERLKPQARQTPEWLATFARKIDVALAQLDTEADALGGAQGNASGHRPFDIGHIALGCALGYMDFRFADVDWRASAPRLAGWHATFEARPSAVATHPSRPS
jgi:glutathione S-transferase